MLLHWNLCKDTIRYLFKRFQENRESLNKDAHLLQFTSQSHGQIILKTARKLPISLSILCLGILQVLSSVFYFILYIYTFWRFFHSTITCSFWPAIYFFTSIPCVYSKSFSPSTIAVWGISLNQFTKHDTTQVTNTYLHTFRSSTDHGSIQLVRISSLFKPPTELRNQIWHHALPGKDGPVLHPCRRGCWAPRRLSELD